MIAFVISQPTLTYSTWHAPNARNGSIVNVLNLKLSMDILCVMSALPVLNDPDISLSSNFIFIDYFKSLHKDN